MRIPALRWSCIGAIASLALLAGPAGSAGAAVEVGQTSPGTPELCGPGQTSQGTEAGPPTYRVPSSGVITEWRHMATSAGGTARFQVWDQPTAPLTLVGRSEVMTLTPGVLNVLDVRISVSAGNLIGVRLQGNNMLGCRFFTMAGDNAIGQGAAPDTAVGDPWTPSSTLPGQRVNVSATWEPDCDSDGFGDETQDPIFSGLVCSMGRSCAGRVPTYVGTDSPELVRGTPGTDVVLALGGNDRVNGKKGNDVICGGLGRDRMTGGNGADRLFGELGRDILIGGSGKDTLRGGRGRDKQKQ